MPDPQQRGSIEQRFWAKVEKAGEDDCWPWLGAKNQRYGTFSVKGKQVRAHRFAYELLVGPIPEGLTIDHLCRNRACVNPAHLEVATNRENVLRGEGETAKNARKTHCKRGHEFTPENTYVPPGRPWERSCKICRQENNRRGWTGQKEANELRLENVSLRQELTAAEARAAAEAEHLREARDDAHGFIAEAGLWDSFVESRLYAAVPSGPEGEDA